MAKAWIARFEQAIAAEHASNAAHIPQAIKQVMRDDYQSKLDELREDVTAYEALRRGHGGPITLRGLAALPDAPIQARIAAGLTQKQLAERLDLKEPAPGRERPGYKATPRERGWGMMRGSHMALEQAIASALAERG